MEASFIFYKGLILYSSFNLIFKNTVIFIWYDTLIPGSAFTEEAFMDLQLNAEFYTAPDCTVTCDIERNIEAVMARCCTA
ncbi:hypothetical protein ABVT39_000144 [Epinephelus coioides]